MLGLPDKIQDAQLNVNIKLKNQGAWEVDVITVSFLKMEKPSQCELKYLPRSYSGVSSRAWS